MHINLSLAPIVALIAGILILVMPKLLNYIIALYLIVIGLLGAVRHRRIFSLPLARLHTPRSSRRSDCPIPCRHPSRRGGEVAVVAGRNVAQRLGCLIELRVDEARRLARYLIEARDQRRPQRRNRAGAADHRRGAVHSDVVTRFRIRIAGNIRHAAHASAACLLP